MFQTAIFVDAGYAYAQGAVAIEKSGTERRCLRLNPAIMIHSLRALAEEIEPKARVLRTYWYDGLGKGSVMNQDQEAVAKTEGIKCRFGTINSHGQQKGVDALIVTDMIELARIQAISDALVLSGDEDVRVGVQVAQTFGIRVHLLGLHPAKGSQSPSLIAEADTHHEWFKEQVSKWLSFVTPQIARPPLSKPSAELEDWIAEYLTGQMENLTGEQVASFVEYMETNRNQLPADFDRPMLAGAREFLGRDLQSKERKDLREELRSRLRHFQS